MERPRTSLPQSASSLVGEAGRYGRMAATILRSGVVPARLDKGMPILPSLLRYGTTIAGLYAGVAAAVPDRPAVIDDHGMWTFGELNQRAEALSIGLSAAYDIGPGDPVGLLARNHAGFVETVLACGRLGAHTILLNTGMSPAQAAVVAEQQGLKIVVVDPELADKLAEVPDSLPRVACGDAADGPSTSELIAGGKAGRRPAAPSEAGRTVVMTSGTTGAPKGAQRPSTAGPDALAAILSRIPVRADETVVLLPPLFHTWGLANLQLAAAMRLTMVLRRRFDAAEAMALVSSHRASMLTVVPVMLQRILELEPHERPTRDLSALRIVASSGSALPGPLATEWMGAYGPNLYNLYGSTEASWATIADPDDLAAKPGTAGRSPLGTRLAIVGEDGEELPVGKVGRIFVGNELQFEGYTGDHPGKEMREGLMATGDVGYLDEEGRLFVAGRDDDMIVSGGENVFPQEVEDLLVHRDDLVEVAVFGVDDVDFGQRLVAFVVPTDPGQAPGEEELQAFVKENLASFSVPREIHFTDELPRNPTGKVLHRDLRERLDG